MKVSILASLDYFNCVSDSVLILTDEARAEAGGVGSHQLGIQLPVLTGREDTSCQQTHFNNTSGVTLIIVLMMA